jgi:hypothetical protein
MAQPDRMRASVSSAMNQAYATCDAQGRRWYWLKPIARVFPIDLVKQEERAGIGLTLSRAWRMARLLGCASPVGKPSLGNPNYLNAPVSPTGRYGSAVFPQPASGERDAC